MTKPCCARRSAPGFGVPPADLLGYTIFRRAWDARRKSDIKLVYTIDAELAVSVQAGKSVRRAGL